MKSISFKDRIKKFLGYSIELPLMPGRFQWLNKRLTCPFVGTCPLRKGVAWGIKKIITLVKAIFQRPSVFCKNPKKDFISQEASCEKTAYVSYHEPVRQHGGGEQQELSKGYGEDLIVLQVRDPWCIYSYWHVVERTKDNLKRSLGEDKYFQAHWALRVYDVSYINFNGYLLKFAGK